MSDFSLPTYAWGSISAAERDRLMLRAATGRKMFDPELRAGVLEIVEDVRENGDAALIRALAKFDGQDLDPGQLKVTEEEVERARSLVDDDLADAIRQAIGRLRRFNEQLVAATAHTWKAEVEPGIVLGERFGPIASAGLSIPGGKGSFPSVLIQLGAPVTVAGVPEVVVCVPPLSDGSIDPAVITVAAELGIANLFRCNGPAGVAAMAFGTETIPQAVKVVGPGSPPVAAAQIECQRFGTVTQMLLGPSESIVIADSSVPARLIAADLMVEAEHGPDSTALLVAWEADLIDAVERELQEQLERLPEPRRGYAAKAIGENGGAVLVGDEDEAAAVANEFAAEHMQLDVDPPRVENLLAKIDYAGEILIGQDAPIPTANYMLGVPAALPTARFARVSSGITVDAFLKRTSTAEVSPEALSRLVDPVIKLAEHEGFPAHAAALKVRKGDPPSKEDE